MKLLLKVTLIVIAIWLLAGLIILGVTWHSNQGTLNTDVKQNLQQMAFNNMDKIDRMISERKADLESFATDPIITSRESSPQQITERLIEFRDIQKRYASLSFFDLNRVRIADTSGLSLGKQDSVFKEWDTVLQGKSSIASDVDLSASLNIPVVFFAILVKDKNDQPFGVIMTRMPLNGLYYILGNFDISQQTQENVSVD
jgi:hypothetical protein